MKRSNNEMPANKGDSTAATPSHRLYQPYLFSKISYPTPLVPILFHFKKLKLKFLIIYFILNLKKKKNGNDTVTNLSE